MWRKHISQRAMALLSCYKDIVCVAKHGISVKNQEYLHKGGALASWIASHFSQSIFAFILANPCPAIFLLVSTLTEAWLDEILKAWRGDIYVVPAV